MSKFKNAKVGDKVYCLMYGEGVIDAIQSFGSGMLYVAFNEQYGAIYTFDGCVYVKGKNPTLYWEKPEIIEKERVFKVTKYRVAFRDCLLYTSPSPRDRG